MAFHPEGSSLDKKQSPSTLPGLPNEILQIICEFLCHHCQADFANHYLNQRLYEESIQSLSSLSLTCCALTDIAQSHLVHAYADGLRATWSSLPSKFLRTLSERKDLGLSVRVLDLHGNYDGAWGWAPGQLGDPISSNTLLQPESEELDVSRIIGRLLSNTPLLKALALRCDSEWPQSAVSEFDIALPSLETLILHSGKKVQQHFQNCFIFDAAANLQTLYLLGHDIIWEEEGFRVPNLPNLRKLIANGPRADQMEQIVRAAPRLVDIEYYMIDGRVNGNAATVVNAFKPAKDRLRRLHLVHVPLVFMLALNLVNMVLFNTIDEPTVSYAYRMGLVRNIAGSRDLRDFTALEELGICWRMVYGTVALNEPEGNDVFDYAPPSPCPSNPPNSYRSLFADGADDGRSPFYDARSLDVPYSDLDSENQDNEDHDNEDHDNEDQGSDLLATLSKEQTRLIRILPPQLRRLRIWHTPRCIERDLLSVLLQANDKLPSLEQVVVGGLSDPSRWGDHNWPHYDMKETEARLNRLRRRRGLNVHFKMKCDDDSLHVAERWPGTRIRGSFTPSFNI